MSETATESAKSGWQNCGKSAIHEPFMQVTSVELAKKWTPIFVFIWL